MREFLWNNPSVHCVNMYCCDWFNKQADWTRIKLGSKVKRIDGMKEGWSHQLDAEGAGDEHAMLIKKHHMVEHK